MKSFNRTGAPSRPTRFAARRGAPLPRSLTDGRAGAERLTGPRYQVRSPFGALGAGLALSLALWLLPPGAVQPLKDFAAAVIRPGRKAATPVVERAVAARRRLRDWRKAADDRQSLRMRVAQLEREAAELRRRKTPAAQAVPSSAAHDDATLPLLQGRLVRVRVLGARARGWLAAPAELAAGRRNGLALDNLALAAEPSGAATADRNGAVPLDAGELQHAQAGQLALADHCVCGKLIEVGRHTSWLLPATAAAYRDEVAILSGAAAGGQAAAADWSAAPRGVLEGDGNGRCRVRLVSAVEPVAVGDVVVAAGGEGVWRSPPRYGTVVEARRMANDAHWQITVKPDVRRPPAEVAVVTLSLDPQRLAQRAPRAVLSQDSSP